MGWSFSRAPVTFVYMGHVTQVDADGNNVSWKCAECGSPVLLVYQNGRRGSSPASPSPCNGGCNNSYYLDPPFGTHDEPPQGTSLPPSDEMRIVTI